MNNKNDFLLFAHRGVHLAVPENTIEAFSKTIQLNSKAVEFDIQIVANELFVFHDFNTARLTGVDKVFDTYTVDEVLNLKVLSNYKIPKLTEVLDEFLNTDILINIEIKNSGCSKALDKILNDYANRGLNTNKILVSSFNHLELLEFSKLNNKIKVAPLFGHIPLSIDLIFKSFNPYSINISVDLVNSNIVNLCRSNNTKIFVYTVNTRADFERVYQLGIDGVFTDQLETLALWLGDKRS
jgi:glycerophosphoryl diester phosphodiesterase